MSWDHRVMAHEHNGEIYLKIHEVYYNKKNKPHTYTEDSISVEGDSIDDLKWTLKKMKKCLTEPILWYGKKFPKEFKKDTPIH